MGVLFTPPGVSRCSGTPELIGLNSFAKDNERFLYLKIFLDLQPCCSFSTLFISFPADAVAFQITNKLVTGLLERSNK